MAVFCFGRGVALADVLLFSLRESFDVANGDALGDFSRLESDALITKNSFS